MQHLIPEKITPLLTASREFGNLGGVYVYKLSNTVYMLEYLVELETDIDGCGEHRSDQTFWNWHGAMDKFDSIQTDRDLFWELNIDYDLYLIELKRWT